MPEAAERSTTGPEGAGSGVAVPDDPTPRAARLAARFPLLVAFSYSRYRRVWSASFLSQLGDWMQIYGRGVLAFSLTGRATAVGLIYFAAYLPQLLGSMWAGVLVDRFDRRRLLLVALVGQASGALVIATLLATGAAELWNVVVASFVQGIFFTLMLPATQALMPGLVPRHALHSAISFGTTTNSVTRVAGPLLGAAIDASFGLAWIFWANAITYVGIVGVWLVTRVPRQPRIAEARSVEAIRAGLRFVRTTPPVWVPIAVATFLAAVGVVYQPLAVAYTTDVLAGGDRDLGANYLGWFQAAIGVGAAVGILGLAGIGRRRPGRTLLVSAVAFALTLTALGLTTRLGPALAIAFALGAMQFGNMTLAINLVQHATPEVVRGRVMSILMLGIIGFVPVSSLAGGALADAVGLGTVLTGAGLACLGFAAVAWRWGRHLPDGLHAPDPPSPASSPLVAPGGSVDGDPEPDYGVRDDARR